MERILAQLVLFIMLANIVFAAEIHGDIYDLSLNKKGNVVVEINTAPKQFYVSKSGAYSFKVPIGSYTVKAEHYDRGLLISSASENITTKDDGDYILDLILFPVIDEEELLEDQIKPDEERNINLFLISAIIIILIIISFLTYSKKKKKRKQKSHKEEFTLKFSGEKEEPSIEYKIEHTGHEEEYKPESTEDDIAKKIIEIIKEEGGRTTQKHIRRKIPFSEAKISLAITELEAKNKIQKIKKGRGNVIIIK